MAHPNIVWLLVDSIRRTPPEAPGDIRGRLPFMERFGREAVQFETCVTTAPSTIMSITAMMTGLPAYFLARNYDDFRFDGGYRHSLPRLLEEAGYGSYAFLRGMETREKLGTFLNPISREHWPRGLKHGQKWRNEDLNRVLERVLRAGIHQPAFLFFHYNPRTRVEEDPHVSERVAWAFERLVEAGFTSENTIFVLCSDHGYPRASTGISAEWEETSRITHDLVLTDDNILIPLYLRYPGCEPGRIDEPVSSLDILPTLLELAGVSGADDIEKSIDGRSLVPLLERRPGTATNGRLFRADSRLMLQSARATAIRGSRYKYVRFHDEHRLGLGPEPQPLPEVLIDLRSDPDETRNLLLDDALSSEARGALETLRDEFERTERRGLEHQVDYLIWRQRETLERIGDSSGREARVLLVFEPETAGYAEIGLEAVTRILDRAAVDVLADEESARELRGAALERTFVHRRSPTGELQPADPEGRSAARDLDGVEYDLVLLFVQDPAAPEARELLKITRSVPSENHLVLDCNFNASRRSSYWYYRFRALAERLPHAVREPTLLLDQLRISANIIRRRVLARLGRWERWDTVGAIDHRGGHE